MKYLFLVLTVFAFALTGCFTPTQVVVEEIDPATGKVTKKTTTSESIVTTVVASTKDKTIILFDNSWMAYLSATTATVENPTPTIKMGVGKADKGIITLHKDHAVDKLPEIITTMRDGELKISATGITAKEPQKTALKVDETKTTK